MNLGQVPNPQQLQHFIEFGEVVRESTDYKSRDSPDLEA